MYVNITIISCKECITKRCYFRRHVFLFQIPPLPMNYRPTVAPAICAPPIPAFCADDEQLNVLKVIEKKPNNNLIDLNNFEQTEDKTNVRVSVLEAFDPLLIKTDTSNDLMQNHKDGKLSNFIIFLDY